jgi:glucuronokinase
MIIRKRVYARLGLLGNPSDGFFGKTISTTIGDFSADVTLWESPTLRLVPHPAHDPMEFGSLDALQESATRDGYYGGLRLIFAACKRFADYCGAHSVRLAPRSFTIAYETTIPRQVGLAGSSAIVTATMAALLRFYGVTEQQLPRAVLPNLVLDVELQELAIAAGLQDRVVQVYGGCMFMDFSRELMETRGYGEYTRVDSRLLPRLYLAWDERPSESGRVHSDVRTRFQRGDPQVVEAMRGFAEIAERGRTALEERDFCELSRLMDANFDLRRRTYGDDVLGARNLEMVSIARVLGFAAKFPGSGGAVVGPFRSDTDRDRLAEAFTRRGYRFAEAHPVVS